jgi:hypothetical protein
MLLFFFLVVICIQVAYLLYICCFGFVTWQIGRFPLWSFVVLQIRRHRLSTWGLLVLGLSLGKLGGVDLVLLLNK